MINRDCKAAPMEQFFKTIGKETVIYNGIAYEGWHCHYNEEEQALEHYCADCRE